MTTPAYGKNRETPRTPNELVALRKQSLAHLKKLSPVKGDGEFTCDKCPAVGARYWAFDAYNTNGGCLAEK